MAEVIINNVSKIYPGNIKAVTDFSLNVKDKELVVLVGPSGCGKSTVLRMIAGLEEITSGSITIGNKIVNDIPPKDRDIAMVFQNYALYPHMNVHDNMAFGLKLRGYKRNEIKQRVGEAASILGISDLLDRLPKALSGGQRQRVAVGRAIVRKPKVFLFDEPLSNLDAKLRVQMRVEIRKLHSQLEATMIYVTHDQTEAMTLGDRIVVMKDGFSQQAAAPITVYDSPSNKFVAGFIGAPPMNFFDGILMTDGKTFRFTSESFEITLADKWNTLLKPYNGKNLSLGIRPENIIMLTAGNSSSISAKVELVEPVGSESYVYLNNGSCQFVCRVDTHNTVRPGQDTLASLSTDKAHFFDPQTGNVIN